MASFEELCQNLPGFVEVTEQPQTEGAYQTMNGNSLQTFVWICPWDKPRLENQTHYIQLDASFRPVGPYCYCCVNSIHNNESVTVAVIVGTSESAELYDITYQVME